MPISIGREKVEVQPEKNEFLPVRIPEPQVKKLCKFLGIQYVPNFVRDDHGNIIYITTKDGKKRPKTNSQARKIMSRGIKQFIAVLCDQLENAKEDENGVKSVVISYYTETKTNESNESSSSSDSNYKSASTHK